VQEKYSEEKSSLDRKIKNKGNLMKIAGVWSGHDCSFCLLENGITTVHAELERYSREKNPPGDSIGFLFDRIKEKCDDVTHFVSVYPKKKVLQYEKSFEKAKMLCEKNGGDFHFVSHHLAHAAHAFYSSNIEDSIVVTIDGGGVEDDRGGESACSVYSGIGTKLNHVRTFNPAEINIGGVWTRVVRYVFRLNNGWPLGGQEGTVMAMAALGDPQKYVEDFKIMLTRDKIAAGFKPPNQPQGATSPSDPVHPYLDPWVKLADSSEEEKYHLAAGFQAATEWIIQALLGEIISQTGAKNLCLAGGVSLNSVAMGKIKRWFPNLENVYIPPVPYDGGLCIGAAQYLWHHVLGNSRVKWSESFSPYLGEDWGIESVNQALEKMTEYVIHRKTSDDEVVNLMSNGKIISVFNSKSESGRRALGNRSILADPRTTEMKDRVNLKVKHRQWFRPFAPSILSDHVSNWFESPQDSPYMQFVIPFKEEVKSKVPAVVHFDGSARLQTVHRNDNKWYYDFIKKWYDLTGVPIVLNTSFNDREPICETPDHALACFLGTDLDYLYFPEFSILVEKRKK